MTTLITTAKETTLQQVLPFVSINSAVLNEILGNIRLLHGQWIRLDSNCTNLNLQA